MSFLLLVLELMMILCYKVLSGIHCIPATFNLEVSPNSLKANSQILGKLIRSVKLSM